MPFIGNSVQNQGFAPAVDYFNGDGTTVTFTLSRPVASVAQLTAVIENVIQNPATAFTVSSNSITFTSAPPSGTNNIWIEYTSLITTYAAISQDPSVVGDITASGGYLTTGDFGNSYLDGTIVDYVTGMARITTGELDDMTFYHGGTASRSEMMTLYHAGGAKIFGTTALTLPAGTTAERPGTPAVGMQRWNTTTQSMEFYNGTSWTNDWAFAYSVEILAIAGGGGGGYLHGGGGGAGGVTLVTSTVSKPIGYSVTVGAGGAGGTAPSAKGANGSNSQFAATTAAIGGGAGNGRDTAGTGNSGGSGGGGKGIGGDQNFAAGSGTSGQGFAGGAGAGASSGPAEGGGGGGGAGAVGSQGSTTQGGNGGAGTNTYSTWASATSTGVSGFYAGGGGGGSTQTSGSAPAGSGGSGGGGSGGAGAGNASNATANTGSGGGGSGYTPGGVGTTGNGGSGIVIVRYLGAQRGTGGTVVTTGGYTYHTFTSSGTFTA